MLEWRPRAQLGFRFSAAPDVKLWAQAVPSAELKTALTLGEAGAPEFVSRVLVDASGERVVTPDAVEKIPAVEWRRLNDDIVSVFAGICPVYGHCNSREWVDALKVGARSNPTQMALVGNSFDYLIGRKGVVRIQRPDRYFGKPVCEMLDGHLMVFRAVHDLLDKN